MAWFSRWRRGAKTATKNKSTPRESDRFQVMSGRRHVADAPYVLPKDDREVQRLDFQHYMLRYLMRGNYAAPVTTPTSILDVGCGTARWATEMANVFPDTSVIGVDLVPPPTEKESSVAGSPADRRPDNFAFVQGNVLEGLPFADDTFEFTHMRLLVFALPANRWQDIANELARVTRPGGWVEWLEGDIFTKNAGPAHERLNAFAMEAARRRGIDPSFVHRIGEFLRDAGLVNVETRMITLPAGSRAGRIGQMAVSDYLAVMAGMKGPLVAMGATTPVEYDQLMAQARVEFEQYPSHWLFPMAFGQRPR